MFTKSCIIIIRLLLCWPKDGHLSPSIVIKSLYHRFHCNQNSSERFAKDFHQSHMSYLIWKRSILPRVNTFHIRYDMYDWRKSFANRSEEFCFKRLRNSEIDSKADTSGENEHCKNGNLNEKNRSKHSKSFRFLLSNQKLAQALASTPKAIAPVNMSCYLATRG